tara:strand:- start:61 stop:183 length:123 start_codon:yes stop_codon:yes gene_type:complete
MLPNNTGFVLSTNELLQNCAIRKGRVIRANKKGPQLAGLF